MPDEERKLPEVTESMPYAEQLNVIIGVLRQMAKAEHGQIKGGARPVVRTLAPWMNPAQLNKVVTDLSKKGYIIVLKKGGVNTVIKVDDTKPLIGAPDEAEAGSQPADSQDGDTSSEDAAPADTPAPDPLPADNADDPTSQEAISEQELAEILAISESLASERDTAIQQCSELRQQNSGLQADIDVLERKLQDRTDEASDIDKARTTTMAKLREAEQENSSLRTQLTEVQQQLAVAHGKLAKRPDPSEAVLNRLRQLRGDQA